MALKLIISLLVLVGMTGCGDSKKKEVKKPKKEEISAEAKVVVDEIKKAAEVLENQASAVNAAADKLAEEMGIE